MPDARPTTADLECSPYFVVPFPLHSRGLVTSRSLVWEKVEKRFETGGIRCVSKPSTEPGSSPSPCQGICSDRPEPRSLLEVHSRLFFVDRLLRTSSREISLRL